jgi:hypothetical protein
MKTGKSEALAKLSEDNRFFCNIFTKAQGLPGLIPSHVKLPLFAVLQRPTQPRTRHFRTYLSFQTTPRPFPGTANGPPGNLANDFQPGATTPVSNSQVGTTPFRDLLAA